MVTDPPLPLGALNGPPRPKLKSGVRMAPVYPGASPAAAPIDTAALDAKFKDTAEKNSYAVGVMIYEALTEQ